MSGDLGKIAINLGTRLRKFKQEYAMEFVKRVEDKTPVRTGDLKNGYVVTQKQEGFILENTKDYAAYVNNGTPFQVGQHMVERTIAEGQIITDIAAERAGLKK